MIEKWRYKILHPFANLLLMVTFIHAWIFTFYYNKPYNFRLSWIANDGQADWGPQYAFGVHYFSDYTYVHFWSLESAPWAHIWNAYPPVAIFLVRIFGIFQPKGALFLWLFVGVIACISPLIYATYLRPFRDVLYTVGVFGIASAGLIAAFDRGNEILFLPPLLYFSYVYLKREKEIVSGLLMALAISLKIYPIIFLPLLLLKRKYKTVISSVVFTLIINFMVAMVWGNPLEIFKLIVTNTRNYGSSIIAGDPNYISGASFIANAINALGVAENSFTRFFSAHVLAFAAFSFLLIMLACVRASVSEAFLFGLVSMQIIPLRSPGYTRLWTLIAAAILITIETKRRLAQDENEESERQFAPRDMKVWWLLIVLFGTPLAIFLGNSSLTLLLGFLVFIGFVGLRITENVKFYMDAYSQKRSAVN